MLPLGCIGHLFWLLLWLSADAKAPIVLYRPSPPNDVLTQSSWDLYDGCAIRWGTYIMVSEFRALHAGLTWHKSMRLNSLSPWPGDGSENSWGRWLLDNVVIGFWKKIFQLIIQWLNIINRSRTKSWFLYINYSTFLKKVFIFRFSTVSSSGWKSTDGYYILL